jgi:hypothetical protein
MDVVLEHLPLSFVSSGSSELPPLLRNIVTLLNSHASLLLHFPLLPDNV